MSQIEIHQDRLNYGSKIPFTLYTRSGDYLWLSGQTAHDKNTGQLIGKGDVLQQTRTIFENIQAILEAVDSSLDAIVRLRTYFAVPLTDELAREYWQLRHEFFGDTPPASTGVQVAGLLGEGVLIEIEAVAYAPR